MDSYDIYEWMVMTVARVGRRVPSVDAALRDAISSVAGAVPFLEADHLADPVARTLAARAHVRVVALAQELRGAREDGVADTDIAERATHAVLVALAPYVDPLHHAVGGVVARERARRFGS